VGQVVADGTILAGPASSGDGVFPSSTFDGQIRLRTSPKQYLACTGSTGRAFSSPSAYAALPNIGTYTPSGLTPPAQALAAGIDAGNVLGPLLANVALVVLLAAASWFAFRRQEL